MNSKRFTLVEVVVVITILSILLAIILMKYEDFKKRSVYSAISSNVKIIQTAIDIYYLQNEKYPTQKEVSLENPQLINVDTLVKDSLIKKDLDLKKIKSQNYWVDVFGRVWGSTKMNPTKINILETDDARTFEFTLEEGVAKYNIYEVKGYSGETISQKEWEIEKPRDRIAFADNKDRYFRLVKSVELKGNKGDYRGKYVASNKNSVYLISIEDEYGLETVPYGLEENEYFDPLISFEGMKEFEIKSDKKMKWIEFYTIEKKPAGSKISYRFKVKDEKGFYGEWNEDFYSLENSKGIIVEVTMKANDEKEKPSLYDLRVLYEFDNQKIGYIPNLPLIYPADTLSPIGYDNDGKLTGGTTESPSYNEEEGEQRPNESSPKPEDKTETGGSGEIATPEEDPARNPNGGSGSSSNTGGSGSERNEEEVVGGSGSGKDKDKDTNPPSSIDNELEESTGSGKPKKDNPLDICPSGYEMSTIDSNGNLIGDNKDKQIAYLFTLKEDEVLGKVVAPVIENGKITNTIIQYSLLNSKDSYVPVTALSDVPPSSCVNIIYKLEITRNISIKTPPFIEVIPPGSIEEPKEETKPINEWKTIDKLNFISTSNNNNKVKWIGFEKEDVIPENTRILYKFSYFTDNGSWSSEVNSITELPDSRSVRATAYLQIKISEIGKPEQKNPKVNRMTFIQADGFKINYSDYHPIALINPSKDNHPDRMVFSTETNIDWDVWTFDPLGFEIVNVEWSGDKRNKYEEAGVYSVNARVQNSKGVWSNWDNWIFTVYKEKPVAVLKGEKAYIKIGEIVNWDELVFDASYDPDQDGIVERQWEGNIKDIYSAEDVGEIELKLRVKDSDGYWSEWTTQRAYVYDDLLWMNIGPKAYDNVPATYEDIDTRQEIYWLEDLRNRKVTMNITTASGSGAVVNILDINGNKLNVTNATTNFTESEIKINGGNTRKDYSFIMPKGAYSIQFINYSQVKLNEISVDISEPLPNAVNDIYSTPFENSIKLEFNSNGLKANIYRDKLYLVSKSDNMHHDTPLHSEVTYVYQLEVEDRFGNRSDRIEIPITTLEYDITFYEESNLKNAATREFTDLYPKSYSHYAFLNKDTLTYSWKFKEGFSIPETLENRAIGLSLRNNDKLEVLFLNGENEPLDFYYSNGARTVQGTSLGKSFNELSIQNIIVPKGAKKIQFKSTVNRIDAYLYDIKFNNISNVVGTIKNVKFTPNYNDISVSWENEGDVAAVEVYRNGVHLRTQVGVEIIEDKGLNSNTEYKYTFIIRDSYGNIRFTEEYLAETLERDISFYSSTSEEINTALLDGFDYLTNTKGSYEFTSLTNEAEINWKPKKGVSIPTNLKGQVLRVYGASNSTDKVYAKIVDKEGKDLPFYLLNFSSNMELKSEFEIKNAYVYYNVILPEGANGIKFFRNPNSEDTELSRLELNDIRFIGLGTMPDEITNIETVPSYNHVVISWTKPKNVSRIDVYRNGVYVGNSDSNTYTDYNLRDNRDYEYSFVVRNSDNVAKWLEKITTKTLERDITFYSNSAFPTTNEFVKAFDHNTSSYEPIKMNKGDSFEVNWKVKEDYVFPENLKGKVLRVQAYSSGNGQLYFNVVNKQGDALPFYQVSGNRTYEHTEQVVSTSSNYYYVILPEGANGINFYRSGNQENVEFRLYDIRFNDVDQEVNLITNIKINPSYNSVDLTWTKPAYVAFVEIYRDGEYVGGINGSSYTDKTVLKSNKEYNYSFIVRNNSYNTKWIDPIQTKTLERDIEFYSNDIIQSDDDLLKMSDDSASTISIVTLEEKDVLEVNWKVKEGYVFPESLKGKVIRIYASSDVGVDFTIVDKEGKDLSFHQLLNNKVIPADKISLSNSFSHFTIILPEGSNGIKFYRNKDITITYRKLNIADIKFVGLETEPDMITDISATPSYNNVVLNWTKPANVKVVDIYRDGVYIGNSTRDTYSDTNVLLTDHSYEYSFIIRDYNDVTKWLEPIQTKTLKRDITFIVNDSKELTDSLVKAFDYVTGTADNYNLSNGDLNVTWDVKEGANFPESLKGKSIRIYGQSNLYNSVEVKVLGVNGEALPFHLVREGATKLQPVESFVLTPSRSNYYLVLPEEAVSVKFYKILEGAIISLSDFQFMELDKEPELLTNIKFTPNYNSIQINWFKPTSTSYVDIYRDNVYIGYSTNSTYIDNQILETNRVYEYSFVIRSNNHSTKWMEPIETKTLEKDISFYTSSELEINGGLVRAFDNNVQTNTELKMNQGDLLDIHWKTKEGYSLPESLKGRILRVIGYAEESNLSSFSIVGESGDLLNFHTISNNRTVETNSLQFTNHNSEYYVILPEGANSIRFFRNGTVIGEKKVYISELTFMGLDAVVSDLENVNATSTSSSVQLSWVKPNNVLTVEVYRDGVFLANTINNSYTDRSNLTPNSNYTYSFILRGSNKNTKWMEQQVEVQTKP